MPIYHRLHLSLLQPVKYLEAFPAICFLPPRVLQFSMIVLSLSLSHTNKTLFLWIVRITFEEGYEFWTCLYSVSFAWIDKIHSCLSAPSQNNTKIYLPQSTLSLWTGNIKASQLKLQEFTKLFPECSGLLLPQKAVTTITKPINN